MLVEVRPIAKTKWHGKKDKEAFSRPKDIEVLYDNATGRYATGLTPEEAEKYSKLLGVQLDDTFNANEPHPYWSTKAAMIRLPNQTVYFNTDKPSDFVKVKNLKASKFVANSMKELEEGKWTDATHVIFDEVEEINNQATKIALKEQAIQIKLKMSDEDKANMVQILSEKKTSVKGRSTDFINVELSSIIDEKPSEFLKYARMGREEVYVRATLLECIHKNILTKEGGSIYYMGDMIAFDYEEAVRWFKDPQNQKMKISIFEKLTK
jgi:hypothetical protein